ncbi:MAG: sporulation protein YqfD [Clostridia bacterium]|nr:sporulation protein YqfD [Clostridia bacterium]
MKDHLGFWQGRVEVQAEGSQIEQFINQLHRRHIPIRSPKREEDGRLLFIIPRRDFARLRQPAFKTGTRIHILKKRGLFMVMRPFRRRWGLAIGLALFLGLIFYSSEFIWQVEVQGCVKTSSTQILEDLKELGLTVGCSRKIDVGPIENHYLMGNDKLSWMSINIKGTTAYVEVKERGLHPKVEDLSIPTNIYAARDGVIVSVRDYGGTRQVQVGDPVLAGDLLVSGDWTDKYGVRRLNHCIATVIAATKRETSVTVPFAEEIRQKTGKNRYFFAISWGKLKFPLYFNKKIDYNNYDIVVEEYPLRIGSFAFPLRFSVTKAEEVELQRITRTVDEAKALAYAQLGFFETDRLSSVAITDRKIIEQQTETELRLDAVFYCEEDIGIEMPIPS